MKTAIEVVVINPTEYGIEETKANELIGNLPQIQSEREILEQQYKEVIKLDLEDSETSKKARELRLKIQKNRTQGIGVWHKTTKDYFLKGGQFIDAVKRKEEAVNLRMEQILESIEKHAEIQEQKRKAELKEKRVVELELYSEFVPFRIELGGLSDDEYKKVFNGAKLQYEAEQERLKKEEQERIENERLNKIASERRLEIAPYAQFNQGNPDLRSMSIEAYEALLKSLIEAKSQYEAEQEQIRVENERLKKEAEEKEKALELERKKAKEEADKLEAKRQAEIKIEREKQYKLEAELQAKKDAEAKAEREKLAEEQRLKKEAEKLAKAPVKKQLNAWVDTFQLPTPQIDNEKSREISSKFQAFKNWAKEQVESI